MSTHRQPLPITVCLMCLNEAHHMPAALAEVREFAEWIVLDTGSTDNTAAEAERLGATVRSAAWEGFSETRRKHFEMASQPWILWIDADEVVTPALVDELRKLFAEGTPEHTGYSISRVMYFEGRWIRFGDWYPDRVMRLFRADRWSLEKRDVHESVQLDGTVGRLHSELPHYSYTGWKDRRERIARYARIWAKQAHQQGRKANILSAGCRAGWRFIRNYIFKKGFLGGLLGIRIAWSCAEEVWLKYAELIRANKASPSTPTGTAS